MIDCLFYFIQQVGHINQINKQVKKHYSIMRWVIIFLIIVLVLAIFGMTQVHAEKKSYKCTDFYPYEHCVKIGAVAKKPTLNGTSVPQDVTKNSTDIETDKLVTEVKKTIDDLKSQLKTMNTDLVKLQDELAVNVSLISDLQKQYDSAINAEKRAKADHENVPSEKTRLAWADAIDELNDIKKKLATEKLDKLSNESQIKSLKKEIISTVKEIEKMDKERKSIFAPFNTIGINLSQTCIRALQNNVTTSCPDYRILEDLGLDTTHKYSGKLEFYDGYWHRKALVKNDYQLYDFKKPNTLVDPSHSVAQRIRMITITSGFNQYLLADDMVKENNTRIVHKDRFVKECNEATINADTWMLTLADTIQYLRSGCKGTLLNTVDVIVDNMTKHQIDTSNKWKLDQWLKDVKKKYKISYIGTNDNRTNPSVVTDEDEK